MRAWLVLLEIRSGGMKYSKKMMMKKLALKNKITHIKKRKKREHIPLRTHADNQRSYIETAKNRSPSYPMPGGTR